MIIYQISSIKTHKIQSILDETFRCHVKFFKTSEAEHWKLFLTVTTNRSPSQRINNDKSFRNTLVFTFYLGKKRKRNQFVVGLFDRFSCNFDTSTHTDTMYAIGRLDYYWANRIKRNYSKKLSIFTIHTELKLSLLSSDSNAHHSSTQILLLIFKNFLSFPTRLVIAISRNFFIEKHKMQLNRSDTMKFGYLFVENLYF